MPDLYVCKKCGWKTNSKKMYWLHKCELKDLKPAATKNKTSDYSELKRPQLLQALRNKGIAFKMSMKNTELVKLLEGDK